MGGHGRVRRRPESRTERTVDRLTDFENRRRAVLDRQLDLALAVQTVAAVRAQSRRRVLDRGAMTGKQARRPERLELPDAGEVFAHPAVRVQYRARTRSEHQVASEQPPVR